MLGFTKKLGKSPVFLSSDESEEGAFLFSRNPRQGQLNLRIASYKLP
jgi:uncharacterized protein (TIGR02588 family)